MHSHRLKALFQRFHLFQCWFREHELNQCWSGLFQSWYVLHFSEPALIFVTVRYQLASHCWTAIIQIWNSPLSFIFIKVSKYDNVVKKILMWNTVSKSEFTEWGDPLNEVTSSAWGSIWKQSSLCSLFSQSELRKVPWEVPDPTQACELRKNSLSFDKAINIWLSVLLNSSDNFLFTLPSISSETWVISFFNSTNIWVPGQVIPKMLILAVSVKCRWFLLVYHVYQ